MTLRTPKESSSGRSRPAGWRRWAFPLISATLVPLFLLGALELGLRLAGYGFDPHFFVPNPPGAELTSNPRFGHRFFPERIARDPAVFSFPEEKTADTFRIFVLGGSAALGVPRPGVSFARLLEAMLEESFPGHRMEVITTAMTAVNSHVVRVIAEECAEHDPDLFLVYLGNNEVVGPYGPGTVFTETGMGLGTIRASILLRETRVGQLLARILASGGRSGELSEWKGLEMFLEREIANSDPRLERVRSQLMENLEAILAAGARAGAGVVLSTASVNQADTPPFASLHRDGLDEGVLSSWDEAFAQGKAKYGEGDYASALDAFDRALAIDDRHAELHFRTGRTLMVLGQYARASEELQQAVDLDVLRFRADSGINAVIRAVAESAGSRGDDLELVDAAAAMAVASETAHGIPGRGLFYEHVHLNSRGNYRLAEAFFPAVSARVAKRFGVEAPGQTPPMPVLVRRMGFTVWDEYQAGLEILSMTSRAPFTLQAGHESAVAVRRGELAQLRARTRQALAFTRQALADAVAADPGDLNLRERFASFLAGQGLYDEAVAEWSELAARVPGVSRWHARWSFALLDMGEEDAALARMQEGLRIDPDSARMINNLALVHQRRGEYERARVLLEQVLEDDPGRVEARMNLAKTLLHESRLDEAYREYERVRRGSPGLAEAVFGLGTVHEAREEREAAIEQYRLALEINPQLAKAHNNIGFIFEADGQLDEALVEYRRALEIDPLHTPALFNAADVLMRQTRTGEAATTYERALSLAPGNLQARYNLAMAYQLTGREARAADQLGIIIQETPDAADALHNLAWILATTKNAEVRNPQAAVGFAARAVQLGGENNVLILDTLAVAYGEAGQFDRARETLERAIELTRLEANAKLEEALRTRLRSLEEAAAR